jgi:YfiH family protein
MPFKTIRGLRVHAYDSFARHVNVTNASTTRHGGVSPAPYDSLNLGGSTEDAPENVDANRAKLSLLTSHDLESVAWAGQVHGNTVAIVDAGDAGRRFESTDALVTNAVEVSIVILTADCAAVSLYDPIKRAIGLVHAGWRGTVAGVASHAIERMMNTFGTDPTDLIAGIGPSIGPCCYEVGSDVPETAPASKTSTCGGRIRSSSSPPGYSKPTSRWPVSARCATHKTFTRIEPRAAARGASPAS